MNIEVYKTVKLTSKSSLKIFKLRRTCAVRYYHGVADVLSKAIVRYKKLAYDAGI